MTALPVILQVVRYRCPFCTRSRAKKTVTEQHIARCWHNPEVRSCKTCVHYEPAEEGPYPEHPGWPESCGAEHDITAGIATGCPQWEAK
ncbi:hypothetical protein RVR_8282 [Actinacidiphila reveromycinica]|uniref:Uncharacterized protein n=1 Tax=Actinacidiphila reveromycinica TaxID=659352 RepID=A0A7U3UYE7_9ACTN|nr:hypothetical protein [Streptomyces sp. SN-593]BBB01048.1 hypothetical protein RVR_8282 [Streptomyces sp. SN-593]